MSESEAGFTLVELITTISMSALFVGLILYFGIAYWRYSVLLEADQSNLVSRLNAQDFVRDTVGTSDGLITQNSIPDTHTLNPDPVAGVNYWQTMHAVPGNITISSGTAPVLYFRRFSVNASNALIMNGTVPYDDEYVLYYNGTTKQLLLRSLANPNASGNRLKTSCPSSAASTSCPADKVILENLDSLDVTYYSRSGNTINWQSIYDSATGTYIGPDFTSVEALQYNFHIKQKTLLQQSTSVQNDTVVRIALRNV